MSDAPFVCVLLGPDGCGKSTASVELCKLLSDHHVEVISVYGSKKDDQYLAITKKSYRCYEFFLRCLPIRRSMNFVAQLYLVFVHFNLELIDNFFKTRQFDAEGKGAVIVYDRYPYDRLLPLTASFFSPLDTNFRSLLIGVFLRPFMMFNARVNALTLRRPNLVIFLDVEPKTLKERRPDFYCDLKKAKKLSDQYVDLRDIVGRLNVDVIVTNNQGFVIDVKEYLCLKKLL